jgi:hypothetical protein
VKRLLRPGLALAAALLAAGCGSSRLEGTFPGGGSLIPDASLALTPGTTIQLDKIVNWGLYAGVAYLVTDPLAPNWHIEEAGFPDDRVHLSLQMKRYYVGGAGEARTVFHRRAKELMRSGGFEGYDVLEYHEGIESSVLGSQRVATGVIRLTGRRSG